MFFFQRYSARHRKFILLLPAKDIHVKIGDTTHVLHITYKIHLLLRFIEIDGVSVNPLPGNNKSDCPKLQKFQETLHLMFQSMQS